MNRTIIIPAALLLSLVSCSSPVTEESNKTERNSIKRGIEHFENKEFEDASTEFSNAMESNPSSERARYNHALAVLHRELADTTDHPEDRDLAGAMNEQTKLTPRQEALKSARETLWELSQNARDQRVAEDATYNLGNDSYWLGDALTEQAQALAQTDAAKADSLHRAGVECFKRAVDLYKIILRQNPNSQQTLQNMYIAQLRIPPEEDNNGGGGGSDNQDQNQDQKQDQQQQQQQQQQQKEQSQALKALENREQQTRRQQNEKAEKMPVGKRQIKKPW